MLKRFFKIIFGLPPVAKRRVIWPFGHQSFHGKEFMNSEGKLRIECDDAYIFYLILERGAFAILGLLGLYIASYFLHTPLDFYLFTVDGTNAALVEVGLRSFCVQAGLLLLFIFFPFHIIQFLLHYNLKTYDHTKWLSKTAKPAKSRWVRIFAGIILVFLISAIMLFFHYVPWWFTHVLFLPQTLLSCIVLGIAVTVILVGTARTGLFVLVLLMKDLQGTK